MEKSVSLQVVQAWELHSAAHMPGKSCSEKSRIWADPAGSDNGLLVVGSPFLPLKDSPASDFCLQTPKDVTCWENLPTPFIVMDEAFPGCSQQEDANRKAG